MFEKTYLIRGLRANKKDEQRYIQSAVSECKREARSIDVDVKAGALLKLTYLAMFGQDMSWASFTTVEVMASPQFINKRIGYMAAAQGFRQDTEVLMLSTNLIKKDIASVNAAEVSLALSGLGDIVTPDLARDLSQDLLSRLNHTSPCIRKKAVLALYKVFLQYPSALRTSYAKLRERLEDSDQGVVSATINVIVELSRKKAKNYLTLAPTLFELLTTSTNNWMLIKIVKLFASLSPLEPRLVKKLVTPLTDIIHNTSAMSLLYECINSVISGDLLSSSNGDHLARLCIDKLRTFFEHDDQNLKYVALIAMTKMMQTHPHLVSDQQDIILAAVDDSDLSIRLRALELVSLLPTRDSLPDIVKKLMLQLMPNSTLLIPKPLRRELILRVMKMCSSDTYKHVDNFDWYVAVLIDLVKIAKVHVGPELRDEIRNVCVRVEDVREFAVPLLSRLASDRDILSHHTEPERNAEALEAALWIIGEYSTCLQKPNTVLFTILSSNYNETSVDLVCSYLQTIPKLFAEWCSRVSTLDASTRSEMILQCQKVEGSVKRLLFHDDLEVQSRSHEVHEIFAAIGQCLDAATTDEGLPEFLSEIVPTLYSSKESLKPIAPTAQTHISPPDIALDVWLRPLTPEVVTPRPSPMLQSTELDEAALEEQRRARRERNLDDPFYIQDEHRTNGSGPLDTTLNLDINSIPVVELDEPLVVRRPKRHSKKAKPAQIIMDEVPDGFVPRPSTTHIVESAQATNVLRLDGSALRELDLSAVHEEGNEEEIYQLVQQAKAEARMRKEERGTGQVLDEEKKPKKKKKKKRTVDIND